MKKLPVYSRLEMELRETARGARIREEAEDLTELGLAKKYGLSRQSVRKAVDNLIHEGVVRRIAGKGLELIPPERAEVPFSFSGKTLKIALVFHFPDSISMTCESYQNDFVKGLSQCAESNGYRISFESSRGRTPEYFLAKHRAGEFDALIWYMAHLDDQPIINALRLENIPQVMINRDIEGVCSVRHDSFSEAFESAVFLHETGHQYVVLINGTIKNYVFENRRAGFLAALEKVGGVSRENAIINVQTQEIDLRLDALFSDESTRPSALILGGYHFLEGTLKCCAAHSIRIPEDLTLISLGDSALARTHSPSISTYREPREKMAETAALLAKGLVSGTVLPGQSRLFKGDFILRESCRIRH